MVSMRSPTAFTCRFVSRRWKYWRSGSVNELGARRALVDERTFVPRDPCPSKIDESLVEEPPLFDKRLITHLERLSLVRFSDEEAVAHLRKAVKYANQLKLLHTTGIEPMETVVEDLECPLRDDIVEQTISKKEVLSNAAELVEDYFVTPPGNIPLEESDSLDLKKVNEWDWMAMNKMKKS
uniref:Glutamyl-tRNA(Gln) amidotransferase subunit C, mitochondrial n=1 Tax=Parascaris univalens TaxID=6257 RepID=A0A914ZNJ0_PARUN